MQFFKLNLKSGFYVFTFIAICFLIYTLQQERKTPYFVLAPSSVTIKIQEIYKSFAQTISTTTTHYLQILNLKEQLTQLEEENQKLKAQLQTLKEVEIENDRLTRITELRSQLPHFTDIAARISGRDLFTDHYSLFIDKGSEQNIPKLAGIITPDGVVGYTIDVQANSARILLLTDRLMSIDAVVQRTRSRGMISGYGKNLSILKFLDRPQELSIGDLVVTSHEQKLFPPGYPIGQISSIHVHPSGVGHYAVITPTVDAKKLSEVLVLRAK
ncbi:MAG: rod shape-determining protein MreC [Bdellovibrionaceae bacterium]|nr:rod shape-determining protein MreC [Pseudobdellovibrionaceae bacterium]